MPQLPFHPLRPFAETEPDATRAVMARRLRALALSTTGRASALAAASALAMTVAATATSAATVAPPSEPAALCAISPKPYSPLEKQVRKGAPEAHVAVPDYAAFAHTAPAAPITGSIRRVDLPAGQKLIALTFDLCETAGEVAGYDGEIVDTLRAAHVPATLFVGGHWATTHGLRYEELAADPLFELGNHTWTHANLRTADDEKLAREVLAPEAAFAARRAAPICPRPGAAALPSQPTTGRSTLFRFPFGACDARSMGAVNGAGMMAIQWDVSSGDPSPLMSADAIVKATLGSVRPGSIVLMHANGRGYHTGAALPRVLEALKAKGYRFVTVSDLLKAGRPVVTETCYDSRPGDTDRYDSWGRKPAASLPAYPAGGAATSNAPKPEPAVATSPLKPVARPATPAITPVAPTPLRPAAQP